LEQLEPFEEWKYSSEVTLSKSDIDFLNEKVNGEKLNSKIVIIALGDNHYKLKATSWVGTVKIPNSYTIVIKPKVGNLNFFKLLAYCEDLEEIEYFDLVYAKEGEDLVDFMAKLFLDNTRQIVEEGIYKNYISVTEEIPAVKGRLLLAQNIRHPRLTHEKFWCEYDELSSDILENQILLYCANVLSLLVKDHKIQSDLYDFQQKLESQGVSNIFLEQYHLALILIQKLNEYYEKALKLCEFILKITWYEDFTREERLPIYGFLYDMNVLFQKFVTKAIQEIFSKYNVYAELRNPDMLERIPMEHLDDNFEGVSKVNLKPDIAIREKSTKKMVLIVDTKYKPMISTNDTYQAIAYSLAFECPAILLLPQIEKPVSDGFKLHPDLKKEAYVFIKSLDFSYEIDFISELKNKIRSILQIWL